jgi:hypothetical protein
MDDSQVQAEAEALAMIFKALCVALILIIGSKGAHKVQVGSWMSLYKEQIPRIPTLLRDL